MLSLSLHEADRFSYDSAVYMTAQANAYRVLAGPQEFLEASFNLTAFYADLTKNGFTYPCTPQPPIQSATAFGTRKEQKRSGKEPRKMRQRCLFSIYRCLGIDHLDVTLLSRRLEYQGRLVLLERSVGVFRQCKQPLSNKGLQLCIYDRG